MPLLQIKKDLSSEISNRERRRIAIKRAKERNVPAKAQLVDYVKLVREDRNR